jgi:tRNA threonylcarbamoyladenosine biosynthesis protein TsaE
LENCYTYFSMEYLFLSSSPSATSALGKKIGKILGAGSILALVGELGSGKTLLTRAVCAGLGVPPRQVNSPTFVLVNEYRGRLPVWHLDLYRLAGEADGVELGIADYLRRAAAGVMIIEWAEKILPLLPAGILKIGLEVISPRQRRLTLSSAGDKFAVLFAELGKL